MKNEQVNLEF